VDPLSDIGRDTTEKDPLVCRCGHPGHLVFRDRSTPYMPLLEFSLEGFTGAVVTALNYDYVPEDLLSALNPSCPKCGTVGSVGYPARTPEETRKWIAAYRRREKRANLQAAATKRGA
jgi:rRNA maturation protein Nop10